MTTENSKSPWTQICSGVDAKEAAKSCAILSFQSPIPREKYLKDITDVIEAFDDDVQSVDITTMNRLPV